MALFPECTESCAQKVVDTADIVRDAIFRRPSWSSQKNLTAGRIKILGSPAPESEDEITVVCQRLRARSHTIPSIRTQSNGM
jgi:hypothetical protein